MNIAIQYSAWTKRTHDHLCGHMPTRFVCILCEIDTTEEVPEVSCAEMRLTLLKLRAKITAPGPNGIRGHAWVFGHESFGAQTKVPSERCLELDGFLNLRKTAGWCSCGKRAAQWTHHPLLLNIGYDGVLRGDNLPNVDVLC